MKRSCLLLSIGAGILALIVLGAGIFLYWRTVSAQANPMPLVATITRPFKGGSYPISGGVPVHGQAVSGAPITKLELWADGKLIETAIPPVQDMYVFGQTWTWAPMTLGEHILVVRAFDSRGQSKPSSAIHIHGISDPGMFAVVTVFGGDTLESLAARYHSSVEAILAANQGLDANSPLSGEIFVPVSLPRPGDEPSSGAPVPSAARALARLPLAVWWRLEVVNPLMGLSSPAAPGLTATVTGCNVQLTINDSSVDESGFFIYRLDPGSSDFAKIATLGSHAGTGNVDYTDSNLSGPYQYYASVYDGSGEAASELVPVQVGGDTCSQLSQTFAPSQLVDFGGHHPEQVYLYLSVNGGEWRRIPQTPYEFMSADTLINLGKTASLLVNKSAQVLSLHGEVWGWEAGALVFLGSFDKNLTPPPQHVGAQDFALPFTEMYVRKNNPAGPITGEPWLWVDNNAITTLGTETFKWTTGSEEATRGQWQIASQPFTGDLDPNPPGLLLTGEAPKPLKGEFVEFPIDLSALDPNKMPTVQLGNQPSQNLSTIPNPPPFGPPFYRVSSGNGGLQAVLQALGLPSQGQVSASPNLARLAPSGINPADLYIRYYVRILPMQGGQPVGSPSGMVILDYYWQNGTISVTIPPAPAKPYELTITDVQPIHFPLSKYLLCVNITYNPYYADPNGFASKNPAEVALYALYPLGVKCPEKIDTSKSILQQIISDLGSALNFVSGLYNQLTNIVVSVLDKVNPACGVSQDVCHSIDVLVVEAAKTYVGLPPSIPNADEIKGLGEDYLTDLAVQKLEAAGIPCAEDCKQQIKNGIDDVFTQVQDSWSNSGCVSAEDAAELGVKPLCLPPGVKSEPDPRGQYTDGIVTVQITRKPGFNDADIPAYCDLGVVGSADNSFWVGKQLGLTGPFGVNQGYLQWQGAPLSSSKAVMNRNGIAIPKVQEGQPVSIPVPIGRNYQPYWIPGHENLWQGYVPGPYDDDWMYLYHGATLGLSASSLCAQVPSNTYSIGPVIGPFEDQPIQ